MLQSVEEDIEVFIPEIPISLNVNYPIKPVAGVYIDLDIKGIRLVHEIEKPLWLGSTEITETEVKQLPRNF